MANVLALLNPFLVQGCAERFRLPHTSTLSFLLFTRGISMGRLDVFRFANLWTLRAQCVHGMVEACRAIAFDWCAPCELSAESAAFCFSSVEGHCSVPFEVGEFKRATSERASWMSNLRSFLRLAVSHFFGPCPAARSWLSKWKNG